MATSGTTTFTLNLQEIVDEAYDRCGLRAHDGYAYRTAIRSLDLLFIEWQNRGTNFWTVDQSTLSLSAGTATYALPATTFDVIDCYIRITSGSQQTDYPLTRYSVSDYATIPNKAAQGRPTTYYIDKQRDAFNITFWQVPDESYVFHYHALTRIEDSGRLGEYNVDVPYRFLPAAVAGLAYKIAVKKLADKDKIVMLKQDYEEAWTEAIAGDRERATWRLIPGVRR